MRINDTANGIMSTVETSHCGVSVWRLPYANTVKIDEVRRLNETSLRTAWQCMQNEYEKITNALFDLNDLRSIFAKDY